MSLLALSMVLIHFAIFGIIEEADEGAAAPSSTIPLRGFYSGNYQKKVAITIDDVPNTQKYEKDNYNPLFLNILDSLSIPITIFINGGNIYDTDSVYKNIGLLKKWMQKEYIISGNHTFKHSRYSEVGLDSFIVDINRGDYFLKRLLNKDKKNNRYFRFPYNDLGKDSIQHKQIENYLTSKGYSIAPFTIESSDWMFNYIYEHHIMLGNINKANEIGMLYVEKTIQYFDFFDSLAINKYGRPINQIYLCHDNTLNTNYLSKIIGLLKSKGYQFININDAINEGDYEQKNRYFKKWGISWFYRWINDQKERRKLMQQEPNIDEIYKVYENLSQ